MLLNAGISTILPVYLTSPGSKGTRRLERACRSVLDQDCPAPLELLIVDDGSKPPLSALPQLTAVLGDSRVTYLRLEANRGLVFALNAGLARARYPWIARIDADDSWRPAKLQRQLQAFASDRDLTLLGTGMRVVHAAGEDDRDCDHVRGESWEAVLEFFVAEGCPFPHGSILARKDIFQLLAGYPHNAEFQACEDFALWLSWVRFFPCGMLPDVLFEYNVSGPRQSDRHAAQQAKATALVQGRLAALKNHRRIPAAVRELAGALGRSVIETGKILFLAFRYYDYILADPELYQLLLALLPDRIVVPAAQVTTLPADRCFHFHAAEQWRKRPIGQVVVHDAGHLADALSPEIGQT